MSDTTTTATPLSTLQTEVMADAALVKQAEVLIKKKDWLGLIKFAADNKATIETEASYIKDGFQKITPLVKEGYKTTEFWLVTSYLAINVYFAYKGISLPATDDVSLGSIIAAYTASRHLIKTK